MNPYLISSHLLPVVVDLWQGNTVPQLCDTEYDHPSVAND
jgi:hypothetical protein